MGESGTPGRTRTADTRFRKPLLINSRLLTNSVPGGEQRYSSSSAWKMGRNNRHIYRSVFHNTSRILPTARNPLTRTINKDSICHLPFLPFLPFFRCNARFRNSVAISSSFLWHQIAVIKAPITSPSRKLSTIHMPVIIILFYHFLFS